MNQNENCFLTRFIADSQCRARKARVLTGRQTDGEKKQGLKMN
jgi:hypothetical protein